MGRIWPIEAIASCFLLTACGHGDSVAQAPTTTAATTTSATTTKVVPSKEPRIDIATLPLCGDVKTSSGLPADCRLVSHDSAGLTFVVRHSTLANMSDGGDTRVVAVDVVGKDGYFADRTFAEAENELITAEPILKDIDGDGRDEVLIPLYLSTGGTDYAVYRDAVGPGGGPHFVRLGQAGGSVLEHTGSGYFATSGKSDCCSWEVQFFKVENSQLRQMVRVVIFTVLDPQGHEAKDCTIHDSSALTDSGLSDAEVKQRFCAEPLVVQAMRDK